MNTKTPCSAYNETNGLVYFARMLDKMRLNASGELAPDYLLGMSDPTAFDARCIKFLNVDYDKLSRRTLEGGSNEEILDWCFQNAGKPTAEQILVWNAFLTKRGWRDGSSDDLRKEKEKAGLAGHDEIQTWVDLLDADEGRAPKYS